MEIPSTRFFRTCGKLRLMCSRGQPRHDDNHEVSQRAVDGILKENRFLLEDNNDMLLNHQTYQEWFDILKSDDIERYRHVIAAADDEMKTRLVHGRFSYNRFDGLKQNNGKVKDALFRLPLVIAVTFCAEKCFRQLLKDGADILQSDINDNNCIHALVLANSLKRDEEESFVGMYKCIQDVVDKDALKSLLLSETSHHMRPLELATKLGTYGLFKAILETRDVYREDIGNIGLFSCVKYNLHEYEDNESNNKKRLLRSPLRLVRFIEKDHFGSFLSNGILSMPCVQHWIQMKKRNNIFFVIFWMVLRSLYIFLLSTMDATVTRAYVGGVACNQTSIMYRSRLRDWACDNLEEAHEYSRLISLSTIAGFAFSLLILLNEAVDFFHTGLDRDRRLLWDKCIGSPFVAHTNFYRICQLVMAAYGTVGIAVEVGFEITDPFMRTLILPFLLVSVLYVLEPIPVFGTFATTLQRMVASAIKFCLLYIFMEFVFTFYLLAVSDMAKTTSMDTGMYYMFLHSLGLVDFGANPPGYLKLLHIFHHLVTNILLVNYLIAVMTNLASESAEEVEAVQCIRRLDTYYLVEERFYVIWTRKLLRRFRCEKTDKSKFTVIV